MSTFVIILHCKYDGSSAVRKVNKSM